MPSYDFKCSECSDVFSVVCRISERYNQKCPVCGSTQYESHHTTPLSVGDPVRLGIRRPDGGFNEVLSKIHNANYKSNLSDKLSRK